MEEEEEEEEQQQQLLQTKEREFLRLAFKNHLIFYKNVTRQILRLSMTKRFLFSLVLNHLHTPPKQLFLTLGGFLNSFGIYITKM